MRKFTRACLALGACATMLVMTAAQALAWSGSGGTGSGSGTLMLSDFGPGLLNCTSDIAVAAKTGQGLSGTGIASVTSLNIGTLGSCDIPGASFGAGSLPWSVNGKTYSSGVTTGTIPGVSLFISEPVGPG